MKRLIPLILLGLLVAACGGAGGALAATVDGEQITVGDVEALIDNSGETIPKDQFATFLSFAIQFRIINAAAESDYGLAPTEEEVTAEADRIAEEFAAEGQTREEFLAERGLSEQFLRNIARQGLIDLGIREQLREEVPEPTTEEVDSAREEARLAQTNVCASHILVETEEEALDVLERLEDGEEFGALATELSTDTGSAANNGILPCGPPNYVPSFQDVVLTATVGEVHPEPVESQFGYHVILVTDRQVPADEDFPADDQLADGVRDEAVGAAIEEWFLGVVTAADVTVEEEFGTWEPESPNGPTVVPPSG